MKVFILCAGEARRFGGTLKQLLKIGDTTILGRQIEQLKKHSASPIVVTLNPETKGCAESLGASVISPPLQTSGATETILFTRPWWDERTIILLGDVIFSNIILNAVMTQPGDIRVFGHKFEIFATSFNEPVYEDVVAALERTRKIPHWPRGKVRYFYHEYIGIPYNTPWKPGVPPEKEIAYYVNCNITRDVDSLEFYQNAIRELITKGMLGNH